MRTVETLEARVDWITATAQSGAASRALSDVGWRAKDNDVRLGNPARGRRVLGYVGESTRHTFSGVSRAGEMVRLGGELASEYAVELAAVAERWTRIDYCITGVSDDEQFDAERQAWRRWHALYSAESAPCQLTRIEQSWGGHTLYVGSRRSPRYLRIYDKFRESGGVYPHGSWRWEVEYKRGMAESERRRWNEGGIDAARVASLVAAELHRVGLSVPFPAAGRVDLGKEIHHISDTARFLAWLARCVRPGCDRIRALGGRSAILDALGLDD